MHLMVLGASRRRKTALGQEGYLVSMHLMVLGASRLEMETTNTKFAVNVSMHLMVLGASRLITLLLTVFGLAGSQCT